MKQAKSRPAGLDSLAVLDHFAVQFDDSVDRFRGPLLGNKAILHQDVQKAFAKHQGGLAVRIREMRVRRDSYHDRLPWRLVA